MTSEIPRPSEMNDLPAEQPPEQPYTGEAMKQPRIGRETSPFLRQIVAAEMHAAGENAFCEHAGFTDSYFEHGMPTHRLVLENTTSEAAERITLTEGIIREGIAIHYENTVTGESTKETTIHQIEERKATMAEAIPLRVYGADIALPPEGHALDNPEPPEGLEGYQDEARAAANILYDTAASTRQYGIATAEKKK
jgi:hypothetical protein